MQPRLILLLPILFLSAFVPASGQDGNNAVTIQVSISKKDPLAFASVTITNRLDSSKTQSAIADSSGKVSFQLPNGQYSLFITAVNYLPIEKGIVISNNHRSFNFIAEPQGKTLEEAVVVSRKPIMRQEDDKIIVEPENLVAASTNGFEVIEKTPGLFVDQDGNIFISSLTPAAVQINGRDMKMSAADVATMLKSLPPGAIDKIEIIKTPSAKYDASSSGGIVNVILKKGVKIGLTGSVNAGAQQGVYGSQFIGFNLANNDGKKSAYINFNYNKRNSYERIVTDRIFAPDTMLSQNAKTVYPGDVFFTSYAMTWSPGKWTLELSGSISLSLFNNSSTNPSSIQKISVAKLLSFNQNDVTNHGSSLVIGNGFETKYKIDSLGSEWSTQVFYYNSHNNSNQDFLATYILPAIPTIGGDGKAKNKRDLISAKSDFRLKMKDKFTFEAGIKSSFHLFNNATDYFREIGGTRTKDVTRTNTFEYNENINSLYLQGSKTLGKDFVVKTGLRLENTNMKGHQFIPADTTFAIHRTDLFPYIYLSKSVMKIAGYDLRAYLVYRRTINRPGYEQLNPFPRYVDQYLSEGGNPALRPQFNQNYEANISVDERPILAIGVNDTKDIFTNVIYQSDTSQRQAFRTYDNLGKNKEWYLRGLGALPPGGRYFFVLGAQYNHNFYQGLYENKPLFFKKGTWTIFTYQTFKIDKRSMLTLNGFMRLKGQQQFYELTSFGALNTSVNRKFMKEKLIVTLSLSDIFATNNNNFTLNQGSVSASGYRQGDTRRFGINLRYNFGIRKKEDNGNLFNAEPPN